MAYPWEWRAAPHKHNLNKKIITFVQIFRQFECTIFSHFFTARKLSTQMYSEVLNNLSTISIAIYGLSVLLKFKDNGLQSYLPYGVHSVFITHSYLPYILCSRILHTLLWPCFLFSMLVASRKLRPLESEWINLKPLFNRFLI